MPNFLKDKQFIRFLIISGLLITGAIGAALTAAAAGQMGDYELASLASKVALGLSLAIMVYVIPRLARNVRLEYLQSGLALNVMNAGWVFCAFILVVTIAAISTGNNLLYMVLAALLATMIVSGVASRVGISNLSVSLRFPDHIFADDPTPLEVTVNNQKRLFPSFSLTVAATAQKDRSILRRKVKNPPSNYSLGDLAHFPILPARAKARARITRTFAKRGVYPVNGFTLRTRFPFGFVERKRFVEANGEVIVYPRPQSLDDFYHLLPLTHGQMESNLKGRGSDLYGIRQYMPNDHPRFVDWKATAKSARLMVREFTRDDDWRLTIALDVFDVAHWASFAASSTESNTTAKPAEKFAEQFERAVTFAASLLTHFLDEGAEIRLLMGDYDSGFGRENEHRYAMLKQLARVTLPLQTNANASPEAAAVPATSLPERMPALNEDEYKILITPSARGSIPANIWRRAHVVYFDDL
ncbi:MAG: DUF58 domain-containing protein [Acidobacteria bacterium]|nr:DUF58 domain-containing protein [Acidobacteriota bacterium]